MIGSNAVLRRVVLTLVTMLSASFAEPSKEPDALSELRERWKKANEDSSRPIREKYLTALKKLQLQLTKQQKITAAVIVRAEIEVLSTAKAEDQHHLRDRDSVDELADLRRTFDREIRRVESANLDKYVGALKTMRSKFAEKGNLDAAFAVKKELGNVRPSEQESLLKIVDPYPGEKLAWAVRSSKDYVQLGEVDVKVGKDSIRMASKKTGRIGSPRNFSPPFRLYARAKTNSTNIRLRFGEGEVILNWEARPSELRMHDPTNRKRHLGFKGVGRVSKHRYHDIEIRVTESKVTVYVDRKERASLSGEFANLKMPVSVGPALGSVVHVESFAVYVPE